MMEFEAAKQRVDDVGTAAHELAEIAQRFPVLWNDIVTHPNVYPRLIEWIDGQRPAVPGAPSVAVTPEVAVTPVTSETTSHRERLPAGAPEPAISDEGLKVIEVVGTVVIVAGLIFWYSTPWSVVLAPVLVVVAGAAMAWLARWTRRRRSSADVARLAAEARTTRETRDAAAPGTPHTAAPPVESAEQQMRHLLSDPTTPPEMLAQIASEHPALRGDVASHPNAYPELVAWIAAVRAA